MALAGLDEHIAGGQYHQYPEEVKCTQCGHVWEITIASDFGHAGPVNLPVVCGDCGRVIEEC